MITKNNISELIANNIHIVSSKFRVLLHNIDILDDGQFESYIRELFPNNNINYDGDHNLIIYNTDTKESDGYDLMSNTLSGYFSKQEIRELFLNSINKEDIDSLFNECFGEDKYEIECIEALYLLLTTTSFNVYLINVTLINNNTLYIKL